MRGFGGSVRLRTRTRLKSLSKAQQRAYFRKELEEQEGKAKLAEHKAGMAQQRAQEAQEKLRREQSRSGWDRVKAFFTRPLFQRPRT